MLMNDRAGLAEAPTRRINWVAVSICVALAAVIAAAIYFALNFVKAERARDLTAWQVRLGIVADSRTASVNKWVEKNFSTMRDLSENASLQLYMTELEMNAASKSSASGEPAQATYLRNLLVATAQRTGFTPPEVAGEVRANIKKAGVAGIALADASGRTIVSTSEMPPISAKIRAAIAKALDGKPALIDMFTGATNLPTIGFVLPIFGIQDESGGTKGIGVVIGMRVVGKDLFNLLAQPGETSKTSETYLVRKNGATVEYLSPLADGTPALKRRMATSTADLAAAYALKEPGGFAIKRDYTGKEVLVVSRSLANIPWVLARKISKAEALAGTETRLNTIFTVFVLIIIGVTVTIFAVWRHGSSLRATRAAEKSRIAAEKFENMSKFMNLVTNSQPTKIVAVTGENIFTFANEPAAEGMNISREDMIGKTMASVIGPTKAQIYADINREILARFAASDDAVAERESHIHVFGEEDDEDFKVVKSDHIPLRGDRDYPPGILMILDDITELTRERRRSEKMLNQLIDTLVSVVDRRDPFSAHHSSRVADVAINIAKEMSLSELEIKTVDVAGRLMNLGKIFIPPEILTKTEELTPEERSLVSNSYLVSVDLTQNVDFEGPVVETVRQMGETWDGSGPLGIKEDEGLVTARILGVANAFVGMISPRAYRGALTFEKVSNILLEQSNSKFDRKPVSALINFLENRGGIELWAHFRDAPEE